ncbi:hypothetical protein ACYOEI_23800 [Singulisphaera rosea]
MLRRLASIVLLVGLTAEAQTVPLPPTTPYPVQRGNLGIGVNPTPVPLVTLIHHPAIQAELKMTRAQAERIASLQEERPVAMDRVMADYRASTPPPDQADPEVVQLVKQQMNEARATINEQWEWSTLNVLKPQQRSRLVQVQAQAEGPFAFTRPDFVEKMNLSPEQIELIQEIVAQGREIMWETSAIPLPQPPDDHPLTPEERMDSTKSKEFKEAAKKGRTATLKARAETMQAITKLFTKGQRANYRRLLGPPYDLAKLQPPASPGEKPATKETSPHK